MGSVQEVAEERKKARAEVRKAAMKGDVPSRHYAEDALAWAFKGREGELASLEEQARSVREGDGDKLARRERERRINAIAREVEQEERDAERAERRQRARAEAERRIAEEDAAAGSAEDGEG
jgi:hypothetical protein